MNRTARNLWLTLHIVCSVGWLGAVLTSLALGIAAVVASVATARSAYVALELIGWWILVPLSVASLASGVVQSFVSSWGLVRHYWVLAKLGINLFCVPVLLLYMQSLGQLADRAKGSRQAFAADWSPVVHAGIALALLAAATVLSVLKPPGRTPWDSPGA
jgi:hypothetical protein